MPAERTTAMAGNGVDSSKVKSLAEIVTANTRPHSSAAELRNVSKRHPSDVDDHIVLAGQQQAENFQLVEKR